MSDDWQDRALCLGVDPERMQPDAATTDEVEEAKGWCASCPVFAQCNAAAAGQPDAYGVWAGRWWGPDPVWEVVKVCARAECGQEFRTQLEGQRQRGDYCSPRCRVAAYRARVKSGTLSA